MMFNRTEWRGGFGLGILGVVLVSLAMAGCSSGSGGDAGVSSGSTASTLGLLSVEASGTAGIVPANARCGERQIEDVWARTDVLVGTVEVSNDLDYLYLKFEISEDLEEEWGMLQGFVQVGEDNTDYPQNGNSNPRVWEFDHHYGAPPDVVVKEFTLPIEFSAIGLDHGACGMTVYVFAMAQVTELNGDPSPERSWASSDQTETAAPGYPQMYYFEYEVRCCAWYDNESDFTTHGQGGWGTVCHGWNPGCYRDDRFDIAFPDGVMIGSDECDGSDGFTMTFTSSEAIEIYLPNGGRPSPLENDYLDPAERTEAGVLASQVLALTLNLGFDEVDENFSSSDELLGDQVICNTGTAFDGWTLAALLEEANWLLAGCESEYGPGEIAEAVEIMNENYSDGAGDMGYICAP
jgi:hypothetical protein